MVTQTEKFQNSHCDGQQKRAFCAHYTVQQ